jgi:hypothetical protein
MERPLHAVCFSKPIQSGKLLHSKSIRTSKFDGETSPSLTVSAMSSKFLSTLPPALREERHFALVEAQRDKSTETDGSGKFVLKGLPSEDIGLQAYKELTASFADS